ncbi:hypothetical protein [Amycolatopsis plumensis]|uniref:Secreted protein n=1 Tax=Amycolatopsis plumensis TaxID=236508 RepID=A0ABV5U1H3_9PSEU
MRKIVSALVAIVVAASGLVLGSGVAAADVVVAPGATGHVCSGYKYMPNPKLYWQSCAWADNNEVWFTVHFGNATDSAWTVSATGIDYYMSGQFHVGCTIYDFVVPAHSVKGTPSNYCAYSRKRAAYQSVGIVSDDNFVDKAISDSLQVQ